jgi:hypothetical protein
MKLKYTTSWNRVRKQLQRFTLLLALTICVLLLLTNNVLESYAELSIKLWIAKGELKNLKSELITVKNEVEKNKNKTDKLLKTIKWQRKEILERDTRADEIRKKLFLNELSKEVISYLADSDPLIRIKNCNQRDIYLFLHFCKKYELIYKKKYPKYEKYYDWKMAAKIIFLESHFAKDPPQGKASELGGPQILEYEFPVKQQKVMHLYPILKKLKHNKGDYHSTILSYRNTTSIQVDCFYEEFTSKLEMCGGDFTRALVAYNSYKNIPEESLYWIKYQRISNLFDGWIKKVDGRIR